MRIPRPPLPSVRQGRAMARAAARSTVRSTARGTAPVRAAALLATAALLASTVPAAQAAGAEATSAAEATDPASGTATETETPPLVEGLAEPVDPSIKADAAARTHLGRNKDRYHIEDGTLATASVTAREGRETVRLDQTYAGLPVLGAQYVVRMTAEGGRRTVTGTSGTYYSELDVDTTQATLPAQTAVARAVLGVRQSLARGGVSALGAPGSPEDRSLTGTDRGLAVVPTGAGVLARHVTVRGVDPTTGEPVLREVYVDAVSGVPLVDHSGIRTFAAPEQLAAAAGATQAAGTTAEEPPPSESGLTDMTGTGTLLSGETVDLQVRRFDNAGVYLMMDLAHSAVPGRSPITTWDATWLTTYDVQQGWPEGIAPFLAQSATFGPEYTEVGAVDAHWAAGQVYEYYLEEHGRDSLDGAGMGIDSLVGVTDWGSPWVNAFWDTEQEHMVYGTGDAEYRSLASDLDVVGHEMTHGVVQHTANLVYAGQSGALNEAIADYFGNAIDVEAAGIPMSDPDASLLGGDLCRTKTPVDCALRDLDDGATTAGFLSMPPISSYDNGGVHLNSTIFSGALWDVREKLGGELADAIVYRALTEYLTPLDDFSSARAAVLAAAESLGVRGKQLTTIRQAFEAHGIVPGWERRVLGRDTTALLELTTEYGNATSPSAGGGWWAVPRTSDDGSAPYSVWVGRTDGRGTPRQVSPDDGRFHTNAVTDGDRVVWLAQGADTEILSAPLTGGEPRVLYRTNAPVTGLGMDGDLVAWSEVDLTTYLEDIRYLRDGESEPHVVAHEWRGIPTAPAVEDGRIAYVRYDWTETDGSWGWALGVEVLDTATGTTVLAGRDEFAESVSLPSITSEGVYWVVDAKYQTEASWYNNSIRGYDFATGTGSVLIEEDSPEGIQAWGIAASDTTLTITEDPSPEDFQGGWSDAILPKLHQYALDGTPVGPASCSPGAQLFPAADRGRRAVWIDTATSGNVLVAGSGAKGSC